MTGAMSLKLAFVVLLYMVVSVTLVQGAITCGQVTGRLLSCASYLKGDGPLSPDCCPGVKALKNAAKTTQDRQAVCKCLKMAAGTIVGLNYGLAAALPSKCGVSIPHHTKISPSTNCNKVK